MRLKTWLLIGIVALNSSGQPDRPHFSVRAGWSAPKSVSLVPLIPLSGFINIKYLRVTKMLSCLKLKMQPSKYIISKQSILGDALCFLKQCLSRKSEYPTGRVGNLVYPCDFENII